MARRLDDRLRAGDGADALVLGAAATATWSETLEMLSEARDLAEELGDTELQAEAMEWRVAGLIALGELDARPQRELAEVHALAVRLRQPFTLHVAEHYASTLALCRGTARRRRGRRPALARVEPAADRPRRLRRLRHPDVRDPPRAGPPRRARAGDHGVLAGGERRAAPGDPASRRCWPSSAWRTRLAASSPGSARDGLDAAALDALAGVADLPRPTPAPLVGDDASWPRCVYRELAPLAGGNVVIGHGVACYGAADRYLGHAGRDARRARAARSSTSSARWRSTARMGATTWLAHTAVRVRADAADARPTRRRDAGPGAALRGGDAGRARSGCPRCWRGPARSAPRARPGATPPDDLSWREVEILRLVAAGSATARSASELFISGHTVANHVRSILRKTGAANRTEAAGYAYRHALLDRPRGAVASPPCRFT